MKPELKKKIEEFRQLAGEATEGPWKDILFNDESEDDRTHVRGPEFTSSRSFMCPISSKIQRQIHSDAAFIAAARNLAPEIIEELVGEVERLGSECTWRDGVIGDEASLAEEHISACGEYKARAEKAEAEVRRLRDHETTLDGHPIAWWYELRDKVEAAEAEVQRLTEACEILEAENRDLAREINRLEGDVQQYRSTNSRLNRRVQRCGDSNLASLTVELERAEEWNKQSRKWREHVVKERDQFLALVEKAEAERDWALEKHTHAISQGREFKEERDQAIRERDEARAQLEVINQCVQTEIMIDDTGYEDFIHKIAKRIADKARAEERPCDGKITEGELKRLNGVVSDDHVTIVWANNRIAGIALAARTEFNYTQRVTLDLEKFISGRCEEAGNGDY